MNNKRILLSGTFVSLVLLCLLTLSVQATTPSAETAQTRTGITDPDQIITMNQIALPDKHVWFNDSNFGVNTVRIDDGMARGSFTTHEYSQLQAFSADSSHILYFNGENGYVIRRLSDFTLLNIDTSEWKRRQMASNPSQHHHPLRQQRRYHHPHPKYQHQ